MVDQATARKLAAVERERLAAIPPPKLADVVQPGTLAAEILPGEWTEAREVGREIDALRADVKAAQVKVEEVKGAIWSKGFRRVADVAAMAEAALRGEVPSEAPVETPEGLARLSTQGLKDLQSGLEGRIREAEDRIAWLEGRVRVAVRDALRDGAVARIAARYAELLREAAQLHVQLDAAEQILGGVVSSPFAWRNAKWLAPLAGKIDTLPGQPYSGERFLADFSSGAGVFSNVDGWKAAVLAATGVHIK